MLVKYDARNYDDNVVNAAIEPITLGRDCAHVVVRVCIMVVWAIYVGKSSVMGLWDALWQWWTTYEGVRVQL